MTSMNLPIELATLSDQAVDKVRSWLEYSKKESVPNADAKRLAAVLQDPNGLGIHGWFRGSSGSN
ncbi:hypothetical protein [Corynebacterium glutamicum]|uniref:hypothetical protein n=1 Tax=Corynebacterium glutamicum TaxID=1718 RepID=UPI001468B61A|nr:hypothetical protein [Corynebacterium glutamicum]GFK20503.1 hypothetical protein KbCgl_30750 [Corynebacterium glutamicum]